MRLSDRLSWLCLGLSLGLPHCATAVQDDADPKLPRPSGGAPSATGGVTSTGGAPASGGYFSPVTGGKSSVASGGSSATGGAKATGGVAPSGGTGGRASGGMGGSGSKTGSGGSGVFGGGSSVTGGATGVSGSPAQGGTPGAGTGGSGNGLPTTCSDGKRGGSETDIDCGGSTCAPCVEGDTCKADSDCDSTQCRNLECAPEHCGDGEPSGDESDSDCGGSCALCALGQICSAGSDCEGNACNAGTCGEPAHCAYGWADDPCGDLCLERTQSDQRACIQVLDCFVANDCGPATCTRADDVCGNNKLQKGTAPYPYAAQVYACLCE